MTVATGTKLVYDFAEGSREMRELLGGKGANVAEMSRGVRTPETTSSPCAFTRKSPDGSGAPVISSRENATPEHERSPRFPKTICCTFTAVPQSSGIWFWRLYATARSPAQESKTAAIAWRSCSRGSWGKSSPVASSKRRVNSPVSARRSSTESPVSSSTPARSRAAEIRSS